MSIPTVIPVGEQLVVGVTMHNTGTASWTSSAGYKLGILLDSCGLVTPATSALDIDTSTTVASDQIYQFLLTIQAPASPASCALQFRMEQDGGAGPFGDTVTANVDAIIPPNAVKDEWTLYE